MTSDDFIVRDAAQQERAVVRDLTMRAYAEYATVMDPASWNGLEQALDRALASNAPAERIVADDGQQIIGSVMLYPPSANAYGDAAAVSSSPEVRLLSVPPEARGRGVGRALMAECVRRAKAAGASALGIHTSRSMRVAMEMYERMGFVRAPAHDFQPPGAEVVEGYRLPLARGGPLSFSMSSAPHRTDIQMRFGDTDALGHVNNASFASYAEVARLEFLQLLGKSVTSLILASLYIDYRSQVGFRSTIYVETWVAKLGNSSMTLGQTIYSDDKRAADVRSVVVHFDYSASKSKQLTPEMRLCLEPYVDRGPSTETAGLAESNRQRQR